MMRVAIFGGTFNPIHLGHLRIGQQAVNEDLVDEVIFMPSYISPHKMTDTPIAQSVTPEHRLRMVQLAVQDCTHLHVSDWEIKAKGVSFTQKTVSHWQQIVREMHWSVAKLDPSDLSMDSFGKQEDRFLILGSDSAAQLGTWKKWQDILSMVKILVYKRHESENWQEMFIKHTRRPDLLQRFDEIPGQFWPISSTVLREKIQQQSNDIQKWLDPQVRNFIMENGLYR